MSVADKVPVMYRRHPARRKPYADSETEACVRRQGSPAEVIVVISPFNPRRSPHTVRHPDPSVEIIIVPPAVVKHRPPERFGGDPVPAVIGPCPTAIQIGTPSSSDPHRAPDVETILQFDPLSIRCERS